MRVAAAEADAALAALAGLTGSDGTAVQRDEDDPDGEPWIEVRIDATRARDVNRALAERGIYASALAAGSDLESIFLQLTGGPVAGIGEGSGRPERRP